MAREAAGAESVAMTTDPLLPDDDAPVRRLTRSGTDKLLGGVAGGLGEYFGVDPLLFRIAFGVSVFFGGLGVLAYVALVAFVPDERGQSFMAGRSRAASIALTVALVVAALSFLGPPAFVLGPGLLAAAILAILGVLLWRALGGSAGDDPGRIAARAALAGLILVAALGAGAAIGLAAALGGGPVVAAGAIVAGLTLLAAGLLGGPRWLILPVIVLVVPLAIVTAAGIDLRGGVGERTYRVASASRLQPTYRLGMGALRLDLRGLQVPAGGTDVKVRVGIGQATVRVPDNACVTTDARVGAGQADVLGRSQRGADVTVNEQAPGDAAAVLHLDANVGLGHLDLIGGTACA
jgi:phage shock protein PspC (stress-responsive transcriptional regulator)